MGEAGNNELGWTAARLSLDATEHEIQALYKLWTGVRINLMGPADVRRIYFELLAARMIAVSVDTNNETRENVVSSE